MPPVYVKKSDPTERITWMDRFIASEPRGGVCDVVATARDGRARAVYVAVMRTASRHSEVAA